MIILDTQKAAELFAKFDVPIAGYIVNRVLPPELRNQNVPAYLKNRLEMQSGYMDKIKTTLGDQVTRLCAGNGTRRDGLGDDRKTCQDHVRISKLQVASRNK